MTAKRLISSAAAAAIVSKTKLSDTDALSLMEHIEEKLNQSEEAGNTWTPMETLLSIADSMPEVSVKVIQDVLKACPKLWKTADGKVTHTVLYKAETGIAMTLRTLMEHAHAVTEKVRCSNPFLCKEQIEAVSLLEKGGVCLITGGPGTGKSVVIRELIKSSGLSEEECLLCAPTGLSARHICGTTIHSSIGLKCEIRAFKGRRKLSKKLIIIDEFSMVDTELFAAFLKTVPDDCCLILVGDYDQLPSIGPGQLLKDFCDCRLFPQVHLTKTYRQNSGSSIPDFAKQLAEGSLPASSKDAKICCINADSDYELFLNEALKASPESLVLSPIHEGNLGTVRLNQLLQPRSKKEAPFIRTDAACFHIGDRVIFEKNNYSAGYMNGDIGTVREITPNGFMTVALSTGTVLLGPSSLEDLSLAYAITIHKMQGSEADEIILILPDGSETYVTRNHLYTAVTRAKKKITIITRKATILKILKRSSNNRVCGIRQMLTS